MRLFEFTKPLFEDRADQALKQFGPKLEVALQKDTFARSKGVTDTQSLVQYLATNISPVHIIWLCKIYVAGGFKVEDAERIKAELEKFDKVKSKLQVKDLNAYKNLNQLYDALEPIEADSVVSGKQQQKQIKSEGATVLLNEPDIKVIIPTTEEAACFYGKGTKWCTAADSNNQYANYNSKGPLYIIMVDIGGKQRKFQLHYETDSFMDERDNPVSQADIASLSKLTGYTKFLNMLIKKHYGPYIDKANSLNESRKRFVRR